MSRRGDGLAPIVRGIEDVGDTVHRPGADHEPQAWEPAAPDGQTAADVPLKEWLGQALGAASMCWQPRPSTQVFDSDAAGRILDGLVPRINKEINKPRLGLATTQQLIAELKARGEINGPGMLVDYADQMLVHLTQYRPDMLTYRTADQ